MPQTREKPLGARSVAHIRLAKLCLHLVFLTPCKPHIHHHQDREHEQGQQCWPLEQEPNHDEDEAHVLWMAYVCIRSGRSEGMRLLCLVEDIPGNSQQEKHSEDHNVAEQEK